MKKKNLKRLIGIFCVLCLCLLYFIVVVGKPIDRSRTGQEKIGNANFFNPVDGEYYMDAKYKIKANDNTSYILGLFNSTGKIFIPEGNFLCKEHIRIKGKSVSITGLNGKTKIIFSGNGLKNTNSESVIINDANMPIYNKNSAQSINISGITFEYKRTNIKSPKTILILSNVNGVNIFNCRFIADLKNSIPVTLLDLYNCCVNVKVSNVSFVNTTNAATGGSIWVRNLTSEFNDSNNVTEDITIEKCDFVQNSRDEIISTFACRGNIKNVKIADCLLKEESDRNIMALSIYSSENQYTGTIDGVILDNNNIITQSLNQYLITIGGEGRSNKVSNVTISDNTIDIKAESNNSSNKYIIYKSNKGTNITGVKVIGNVIKTGVLKNTSAICYADEAADNKITGKLKNGIIGGYIRNNTVDGVENSVIGPYSANQNNLINTVVGITSNKEKAYITGNVIYLDKDNGVCGIKVQNDYTLQQKTVFKYNTIHTFKENQFGFIINGFTKVDFGVNTIVGPGQKTNKFRR